MTVIQTAQKIKKVQRIQKQSVSAYENFQNVTEMFSKMNSNDLKSLKKYLDSDQSDV